MKRIFFVLLLAVGFMTVFPVKTDAAQHEYFVRTTRHGSDNFPDAFFTYDYSIVMQDVDGYTPHPVIIEYTYAAGEGTNLNPSRYASGELISSQVYCFYSKSDGTYRPFKEDRLSPASDGYVSYRYYYSVQNGDDFNDSESESMGAFLSVNYDKTSAMNIPVLHVPNSERKNIEQIVSDYFINGDSSYLANKGSLESYPPLTDEYIIEDGTVGRVNLLKLTVPEKKEEPDTMEYLFTWAPRIGETAPLPADPAVRLQVLADLQTSDFIFFRDTVESVPLYSEFRELMIYGLRKGSITNHYINQVALQRGIDNFSGYVKNFYFRILHYNKDDNLYHAGGWVRTAINVKALYNGETENLFESETGYFSPDGGWVSDQTSDDSYKFSTDRNGQITDGTNIDNIKDNIDPDTLEKLEQKKMDGWSWDNINSIADFFLDLPKLIGIVFSYIPSVVLYMLTGVLLCVVAMRILGR